MLTLGGRRVLGRAARPFQPNRNIFSHSRLDIDPSLFAGSNDAIGPKQAAKKEIIQNNFKTSRLKKVLVDDVDMFLALSVTASDLQLAKEMVAEVAADEVLGVLHPAGATELFLNYNRACHLLSSYQEATAAWGDASIMERFVLKGGVGVREAYQSIGIYMDLLLDCGQYDEVVELFSRHEDALVGSGLAVRLVLLALYKQRTEQALATSVHILDQYVRNKNSHTTKHTQPHIGPINPHRDTIGAVALLAFDLGEYAKAIAILERFAKGVHKGSLLTVSLRMMCLAKCDRLDEAVLALKQFLPVRDRFDAVKPGKRKVLYAAVECVVAAAASNTELFNGIMNIVKEIEDNSEVIETTIEEFLFRKIDNEKVTEVINKDDI